MKKKQEREDISIVINHTTENYNTAVVESDFPLLLQNDDTIMKKKIEKCIQKREQLYQNKEVAVKAIHSFFLLLLSFIFSNSFNSSFYT